MNYDYLKLRIGLLEEGSRQLERNHTNDLLLKILTSHNLGGLVLNGFPLGLTSKSGYRDLLLNFYHIQKHLKGRKINIDLWEILYFEHIILFGYHNISKNQIKWSNLVKNFEMVLNGDFYSVIRQTESNIEINDLCIPFIGMSESEFDNHFFDFYERVVNSYFRIKGIRFQTNNRHLTTHYKGKVVCIFHRYPTESSLYNTIRVIIDFVQKLKNKKDPKTIFDTISLG